MHTNIMSQVNSRSAFGTCEVQVVNRKVGLFHGTIRADFSCCEASLMYVCSTLHMHSYSIILLDISKHVSCKSFLVPLTLRSQVALGKLH